MKQVLQNLRSGVTEVADVPAPSPGRGQLLIRSTRTLVSAGTERMLVAFGQASLLGKATAQPERVRQVLDKIRTDGLKPTIEAVFNKLDQPLPLGYSNVGIVCQAGPDAGDFIVGDRLVSNGKHAELVAVAKNLCAKVPHQVTDDEAAFTVVGAIGLQGIRLVQPTLGEAVVVTGLGLIGLITVQLLRAHGCRVMGIDFDESKLALARQFGAEVVVNLSKGEDALNAAQAFSRGRGVDAVIITASTKSNEPVQQAALMCRKRGRIVLVGVTGLELSRRDFYEKELTFQVSCSYGPGRYDANYEEKGVDYPVGFVRWTEQRNFEAVLDMMTDGRLDVKPLISHRFAIAEAAGAYDLIASNDPSVLGILLEYQSEREGAGGVQRTVDFADGTALSPGGASLAVIGAGNYATAVLIPALKAAGATLRIVGSKNGVSGVQAARKFGFQATTTDAAAAIADPGANTIVISTRHDTHAALTVQAIDAGKHVFVEKPLALSLPELASIDDALRRATDRRPILMVGFNRRFAPQVVKMKALLDSVRSPRVMAMTVNAGSVPSDHWVHDPAVGGGRIVGEMCHFVDLLRHLAGSPIVSFSAVGKTLGTAVRDTASVTISFEDGSMGTILYVTNGHKSFPKERIEVFAAGRVLKLDNFRKLTGYGWPGFRVMNLWNQDKGQRDCAAAFVRAVQARGTAPIPIGELMEVSRASIEIADALR